MDRQRSPPLSIKVIASLFLISSLIVPWVSYVLKGTIALGVYISGWLAVLYTLLSTVLLLYAGVGLWRLQEKSRLIAIGWLCWGGLNCLLLLLISPLSVMLQSGAVPRSWQVGVNLLGSLLSFAVQLWFLIRRKQAFIKSFGTVQT